MAKGSNFQTYKEQVLELMKSLIIVKKIKPGEILNEQKIACELDISRTPVREAIQELEKEGWVKVLPWKGAVVQSIALQDIKECFQLRRAIEPMIIELIAENLKEEDFNNLNNILKEQRKLAEEDNADGFVLKDKEFHLYLTSLTGNKRIYKIIQQQEYVCRRIGVAIVEKKERYRETLEEYQALLTLLKQKDILAARNAILEHLTKSEKSILKVISLMEK